MKKLHLIIPVIIVSVMLLGCFGGGKEAEGDSTTQAQTTAEATGSIQAVEKETVAQTTKAAAPTEVETNDLLPLENGTTEFTFSSGAGGWATVIHLNADGSFSGKYHDSEMGSSSEDYPNGTVYTCSFDGRFGNIKKIDEYSYEMVLEDMNIHDTPDAEWIESGTRYISSSPYGLESGKAFVFYLPETPFNEFPEDNLRMWNYYGGNGTNLDMYAIRNLETEYFFFSY